MSGPRHDVSWLTDEVLDQLLRGAALAPKAEEAARERILAAVTAPGAAQSFERVEEALERGDLAPRVPGWRRDEILAAAVRDGAPAWERWKTRARSWLKAAMVVVPAAAAATLVLVLARPGDKGLPEPTPGVAPDAPYIGEKGAAEPPVSPRYRVKLWVQRLVGEDLRPVGELRREASVLRVPGAADLSLVYENREARPLWVYVALLQGQTVRLLSPREEAGFRLEPGGEEGHLAPGGSPTFGLVTGATEARLLALLAPRPIPKAAALLRAIAQEGRAPMALGLGPDHEVLGARLLVEAKR